MQYSLHPDSAVCPRKVKFFGLFGHKKDLCTLMTYGDTLTGPNRATTIRIPPLFIFGKPILKKKVLESYKNAVDSFFYKGEVPESIGEDLGSIIAEIYASDKTILSTISDIEDRDTLDSIIRGLEKMEETDILKVIKAYLRSARILKDI